MAFNANITPGAPPLLWSEVHDAFRQVNENFTILVSTIGDGSGLTPLNFETLNTNVTPIDTNVYKLGSITKQWKAVHTAEWSAIAGSELNGLWAGSAQIKGIGLTIDLPENSTVNGELIIDPEKRFFKTAQVDNGNSVVADNFSDTLNLNSGIAMQLVVDSSAESITFNNTGVTQLAGGSGISVNAATGSITVTNTGVRSLTSVTGLPVGRSIGAGINIDSSTGDGIKITNTGILEVQAGFGITVSTDDATGISTVSFNSGVAPSTAFTRFHITGDFAANDILSDATADTFNITQGYGILLSNNPSTDTLTIALNQSIDIKGSVFGDDSSLLVDAVNNYIYGNVVAETLRTSDARVTIGQGAGGDGLQGLESIAIGQSAGGFTQGDYAVAIGSGAGNIGQGDRAVAIGATAGVDQGDYAISIGNGAGYPSAVSGSIAINASGFTLDAPAAGFYVNPIRSTANGTPLMYNSTTKEVFTSSVLEFVGSKISTSDSSGLTVDVLTTFNTDVVFENDITVAERLTVKGSRVINLSELKAVVAASTDFNNFKTRIAALV